MPDYTWVPGISGSGRYRNQSTGRFVNPSEVRNDLDLYLQASNEPIKALSEQLRSGAINIADWQTTMMTEIKNAHLNAIAETVGGYENMTPEHNGRAGAYIREQYKFLRDFANQIEDGTQPMDGTISRRSQLFIKAGRESYYKSIHAQLGSGTASHVRSIRFPGDSCEECKGFDGVWFVLGSSAYKLPGNRICNKNCRCSEQYGTLQEDGSIRTVGNA